MTFYHKYGKGVSLNGTSVVDLSHELEYSYPRLDTFRNLLINASFEVDQRGLAVYTTIML